MEVSVLVVTWNSAADVAACLDAALAQDGVDLEVLVVDNASTDGTRDVLATYADRVRLLPQDVNLGYAAANNLAAGQARGRLLLLLNPDAVMDPGCVRRLLDHLRSTTGCGAAAALLRYADGSPQCFARREETLRSSAWVHTELGSRLDVHVLGGRHRHRRWYGDEMGSGLRDVLPVDGAAAACVLLRRPGGRLLDERFPLVWNDTALYRRLRQEGLAVHVVPTAGAVHGYGASLARVPAARMRAEAIASLVAYADLFWSPAARVALRVLLLLDLAACGLLVLAGRRPEAARRALAGTAGGLGLPGGARPWLSSPRLLGLGPGQYR